MRYSLSIVWFLGLLVCWAPSGWTQSPRASLQPSPAQGGDPLSYDVQNPLSANPHTPILIALHGAGSTGKKMGRLVKRLMRLPLRVVLPNAPFPTRRGHSWYQIRRASSDSDAGFSVARLVDLLETLRHRWPEAPSPYLVGYSQGAVIALRLTAEHPQLVSGTIALAGYLVPDNLTVLPASLGAPGLFLANGRRDRTIPFQEGREAAAAFRVQGYEVLFVPHGAGHGCPRAIWKAASRWLKGEIHGFSTSL
jgi:predicted esterase